MYLDYFSLERHPFRITPDPSLFFPGGAHGRGVVLDALVYGITSGEGILKVVGEVGSGKTMLCRMLEERLPDNIGIVYIANPSLGAREIVYAIAIELGLEVDANTDRLQVMHKLQEYLLRKHGEGGSVVVFIEEAQSMPLETLEEVRLLSNLETHRHKLMQIVLFGQPELDRKLEQKSIRQLRERITHSFQLDPLNVGEIREYLHFRLQSAGCPWPQLFHPKAELLLARASGGLTRRVNILADKSLLASYADPATRPQPRSSTGEIQPMVLPRHVKTAIADSAYKRMGSYSRAERRLPLWVGYSLAAGLGALLVWGGLWLVGPDATVPATQPLAVERTSAALPAAAEPAPEAVAPPVQQSPVQASAVEASAVQATAIQATAIQATTGQATQSRQAQSEPPLPTATPAAPALQTQVEPAVRADIQADIQTDLATTEPSDALPEPPELPEETASASVAVENPAPVPAQPLADESHYLPATGPTEVPQGLIAARQSATTAWLDSLADKSGYTIQLYSVAAANRRLLEEFLDFLSLSGLLDETWLCRISGNSQRAEQWLVLHGEFPGLSDARQYIAALPPFVGQHGPYARNLDGVACANASV